MNIHQTQVQREFAMRDAGNVQKVVNEPRLQFHIIADRGELRANFGWQLWVFRRLAGEQQHRIQRRAQFMRKRRQKIILGARGRHHFIMRPLQFPFGLLLPVMSRPIFEAPMILPLASLMGETVSEISTRLPSLRRRTVS